MPPQEPDAIGRMWGRSATEAEREREIHLGQMLRVAEIARTLGLGSGKREMYAAFGEGGFASCPEPKEPASSRFCQRCRHGDGRRGFGNSACSHSF